MTDDDTGGTLGGRSILTERGQIIKRDKDQFPSSPVLTGLYGWYRADLLSLNNGDPVVSWSDQSGLNNTLEKLGGASIIYESGGLNGLFPIVRFSAAQDLVAQLSRNDVNNIPAGPISPGGIFTGATQVFVMRCLFRALFADIARSAADYSDNVAAVRGNTTGAVTTTWSNNSLLPLIEPIDDWQVISLRNNNADGAISLQTNTQSASGTTLDTVNGNAMGFINGHMEVAEGLFYRSALSDDDLASTRLYLADKYGLSITV